MINERLQTVKKENRFALPEHIKEARLKQTRSRFEKALSGKTNEEKSFFAEKVLVFAIAMAVVWFAVAIVFSMNRKGLFP